MVVWGKYFIKGLPIILAENVFNKVWRERERKEELGRFLLHSKKMREYPQEDRGLYRSIATTKPLTFPLVLMCHHADCYF